MNDTGFQFVRRFALLLLILVIAPLARAADRTLTVYTSVDDPYARPILREFEKSAGIKITLITDAEASKSVGLAERLRAEKDHPRCDVFWANEPFHTLRLADEKILASYESPAAADIPDRFKDAKNHLWASNAFRIRVVLAAKGASVASHADLARPNLKGKIAMARPTAGTTGGHVAALYSTWGDAKARAYLQSLRANDIALLGGNSVVATEVAAGTYTAGLTDNDDAAVALKDNPNLVATPLDQDGQGTLAVPVTVALVAGAPNADDAKKLIDHLLSKEVAKKLVDIHFAHAPTRAVPPDLKLMDVDYAKVSRTTPAAIRDAVTILEGRNE